MNQLLRWLGRSRGLRDYLEGAAMVLAPHPAPVRSRMYIRSDVIANIADMHAVGRDLRKAMDEVEGNGIHSRKQ